MADIENVIRAWECCNPFNRKCKECPYEKDCYHDGISRHMVADAIELLKEQDELLRKLQKDKDKLCLEVSEWKHKFHDAPPKFVSQGVVDQICWERDIALSQLEQIGKGLGSKMDDIVARLKEQEAVVRCKDCKHKEKDGISEGYHYCNINGLQVTDDWFCADGERREQE